MSQITRLVSGSAVPSAVNTLRGDVGGLVSPTANNIDLLGGIGITTTGVPASSSITFDLSGTVATSVDGDSGTATPAGNVLTLAGGSNITSSAAGSTVTFDLDSTISISGSFTAGTGITSTTGNISASSGNMSASGSITASTGNITATAGDLVAGANLTVGGLSTGVLVSNGLGNVSSINGTDGQLVIGATGSDPLWANLVSGDASIVITNAANSIDLRVSGSPTALTFAADSGSTVPIANTITMAGGTNINTIAMAGSVSFNLDNIITVQGETIDPGLSGDSALQFDINSINKFIAGVDDSDGDSFKVSQGGALGINDFFVIDSNGHRLLPMQSSFFAQRNTTALNVTGDGTVYTVAFDVEVFDRNGDYNPITSEFMAPVDGLYCFGTHVLVACESGNNDGFVRFNENGGAIAFIGSRLNPGVSRNVAGQIQFNHHILIRLNTGDLINVDLSLSGTGLTTDVIGSGNGTVFYGWLVA